MDEGKQRVDIGISGALRRLLISTKGHVRFYG